MIPVTVFGADGFIGRALVAHLRATGRPVNAITRRNLPMFLVAQPEAGDVIYCLGLTADFRSRPLDTAEAHVGLLARLLAAIAVPLVPLSCRPRASMRGAKRRGRMSQSPCSPTLAATSTTSPSWRARRSACPTTATRCAWRGCRMSIGPGMHRESFLGQILAEGAATGSVMLHQSLLSAKDYLAITEVVPALLNISRSGAARLYNIASGVNTTHDAIARVLSETLGWHVMARDNATAVRFPRIDIGRLTTGIRRPAQHILDDLPQLAQSFAPEVAC